MTAPTPQPGDEVLIRARVQSLTTAGTDLLVNFESTTERTIWVREDLVAEVIPAAQTKTHAGNTVADTREAIGMADRLIATREQAEPPEDWAGANALILDRLRVLRAELVADLEAVGVPVEEPA